MNHVTTKSNELYTSIVNSSSIIKSVHSGIYSQEIIYGQTRTKAASFNVTASKSILILNFGTSWLKSFDQPIVNRLQSIEVNDDGLYFTLSIDSSSNISVYFYWEVIEFY